MSKKRESQENPPSPPNQIEPEKSPPEKIISEEPEQIPINQPEQVPEEANTESTTAEPKESEPELSIQDRLAQIADSLAHLVTDFDSTVTDLKDELELDSTPIIFRRHKAADCGIVFKVEFYRGGECAAQTEGTIPMLQLLSSNQLRDAWTKFCHTFESLVTTPFLNDAFAIIQEVGSDSSSGIPSSTLIPDVASNLADT